MTSPPVAASPRPEDRPSIDCAADPDGQFAVEWQVAERRQPLPAPTTVEGSELP